MASASVLRPCMAESVNYTAATNSPSQQVRGAIAGNRHEIGLLWQGDPLSPFAWFGEGHPRKGQHIAGKRVTQQPRGVLHLHG